MGRLASLYEAGRQIGRQVGRLAGWQAGRGGKERTLSSKIVHSTMPADHVLACPRTIVTRARTRMYGIWI